MFLFVVVVVDFVCLSLLFVVDVAVVVAVAGFVAVVVIAAADVVSVVVLVAVVAIDISLHGLSLTLPPTTRWYAGWIARRSWTNLPR